MGMYHPWEAYNYTMLTVLFEVRESRLFGQTPLKTPTIVTAT